MPFVYDPLLKGSGYRDTATGRLVSRTAVQEQIETMISRSQDVTLTLSQMVDEQTISPAGWRDAMRQEIKDNYLAQYFVGAGGRDRMTQRDWGSVGGMLSEQYGYMEDFYAQVAAGELSQGQIYSRSRMYINSSREAFERGKERGAPDRGYNEHRWVMNPSAEHCEDCEALDALGWIPLDQPFVSPSTQKETLPGMGDTLCLTNCGCHAEYRKGK